MCLQKHQCAISPPIINLQKCMVTDFIFAPCDIKKISDTVVTNHMITHVNFGKFN